MFFLRPHAAGILYAPPHWRKANVAVQLLCNLTLQGFPKGSRCYWHMVFFERGGKTPTPKISALLRKRPVLHWGPISSLLRTENGLTTESFVVNYTGRGLVVKRPGVLSKVQMLNLVLGVGVLYLLPIFIE